MLKFIALFLLVSKCLLPKRKLKKYFLITTIFFLGLSISLSNVAYASKKDDTSSSISQSLKIEKPTKKQKQQVQKFTKDALKEYSLKDDTKQKISKWKIKNRVNDDEIEWIAKVKSAKHKKITSKFIWTGKTKDKPVLKELVINGKDIVEEEKKKEASKKREENILVMFPDYVDSLSELIEKSDGILVAVVPDDKMYTSVDIFVAQDVKYVEESAKKQVMDVLGREVQNRVSGYLTDGEKPFVIFKYSETKEQLGISRISDITTFKLKDK